MQLLYQGQIIRSGGLVQGVLECCLGVKLVHSEHRKMFTFESFETRSAGELEIQQHKFPG